MSLINSLLVISFIANLALGSLVLMRRYKDSYERLTLGLTSGTVAIWALSLFFYRIVSDLQWIELLGKLVHILGAAVGPLFFLFALIFVSKKYGPQEKKISIWLIVFYGVNAGFIAGTDFIVGDAYIADGVNNIQINFGYYIYILYLVAHFNLGFFLLARRYLRCEKLEREQIKYILIGTIIAATGATIFDLLYPIFGDYSLNWVGPVVTFVMVASMTYAIVRYRLMNIKLIIAKSFLYFLLVALVSTTFTFTTFLITKYYTVPSKLGELLITMAVSFAIVLILDPLKRLLAKITDDIFFKDKIDYQRILRDVSIIIAKEIDLEILLGSLKTVLTDELKVKAADVLVKKETVFQSVTTSGKEIAASGPIVSYFMRHNEAIITDEFYRRVYDMAEGIEKSENQKILNDLERNGIEFCFPVQLEGELRAIIILGQKQSGDIYTTEDIAFFTGLAPQIAVAIDKSRLYESISEFNLQLQDKINKATRDLKQANLQLQDANIHLQQLDKAKSEFLSIASHQLRTPISAIKGYLSMILEGDFGPMPDKQRKIVSELFESAARLARLINIFLNVSRIESGRFKLEKSEVEIDTLVESVLKELRGQAETKSLSITFEPSPSRVKLFVDSDKIREVILNLADNAIKYTQKGHILIKTYEQEGQFHFLIKDEGIGIQSEDVGTLFQKFVRGTGIAQINTQGSGLGLYIAQRVVAEHGGKIWAESEGLYKGSTFRFTLPMLAIPSLPVKPMQEKEKVLK